MDLHLEPRSEPPPGSSAILPVSAPNANVTRKRRNTTCDHCRKRHVKCEKVFAGSGVEGRSDSAPCKQCAKDGVRCTRSTRAIRFSDESGKVGKRSVDDQLLRTTKVPKKLVYIDETAELNAIYNEEIDNDTASPRVTWMGDEGAIRRETTLAEDVITPEVNDAALPSSQPSAELSSVNTQTGNNVHDSVSDRFVLRGLVKTPWRKSATFRYNRLEFLLLGYYIDHLSMWLDFCDPQRHFQLVVPQRARQCPPLMNAILAASARHLTRVPKHRTETRAIRYDGRILHELTDETALHYHNKCIHDLLTLGADPEHTRNEDLLAAAIILRFYEEVDYPLQDEERDNELFLRVINIFIEAQIPIVPLGPLSSGIPVTGDITSTRGLEPTTSPAETYNSTLTTVENRSPLGSPWYMANLRQAAFWVAFRQEVYSAFLKQRPFNMSLSRCDVFRSFAPAEDALWTARLVVFCADVLEFCYGSTSLAPSHETDTASTTEKWTNLRTLSEKWIDLLPPTFEPIYFREADRASGEVFPEICYLTNLHVAGVQHIELARILLAVYDPTIPRLGLGHKERMRVLGLELRASVLRLCGIAVYNRKNPPSLTTALLGILVCGEYFDDRAEQVALLGLLDELEFHHGWPVGSYRLRLKEAWRWPA
ncbi:hypothetical protein BJY04DRAFT_184965 [Aspergillus karnatakaensis]|uniref:Zn(II)2Cys6 transcription factor n=1 Tax=Aspergillus karnatakaensis TaxID=1810916 RepID=UPI003CCD9961